MNVILPADLYAYNFKHALIQIGRKGSQIDCDLLSSNLSSGDWFYKNYSPAPPQPVDENPPPVTNPTSINWSSITGKPSFANVAFSGMYKDLFETPAIPEGENPNLYEDFQNKTIDGKKNDIFNIPISGIDGLQYQLDLESAQMNNLTNDLNFKADKTTVEDLTEAVGNKVEASLYNSFVVYIDDKKADKTQLNSLNQAISSKADNQEIVTITQTLAQKANSSDVSTLQNSVSNFSAGLNNKADKTVVESLITTVNSKADGITTSNTLAQKANQTDLLALVTTINGKVNQTDFNTLSASVTGKADASALANLSNTVNGKADISAVNGKVNTADFDTYKTSVTSGLNGKVNSSDFTNYQNQVSNNLNLKLNITDFDTYKTTVTNAFGLKMDKTAFSVQQLPHGFLENRNGVKTFFGLGSTNASGELALNLTMENTTNGTNIFTEIWYNDAKPVNYPTTAANIIFSYIKSLAVNLKQTVHSFVKPNVLTLAVGLLYNPITTVGANIPVIFRIEGV